MRILLFALLLASGTAAAYPHKTVTLVTHSSPGGGSDVFLRSLAKHLGPKMGVHLVVENVSGGSGARAVSRVAQAPADGSVLYATTPTYIQTTLLSKPRHGYDSLAPMAVVFFDPEVIYTRAGSPHRSLPDAIAHAKASGKGRWGASNPASLERIAMERLNRLTGARAVIVSHEGGGDQVIGVLNGTYAIGIGEIQELRGQLEAGKLRVLAALTDKRLPGLDSVPTAREQGIDLAVTKFRGLAGPKKLPAEVLRAWEDGLQAVLADPAYRDEYVRESLVPAFMGHDEATRFTARFAAELAASMRELGLLR
jgi:tripartite-type tricarboxylate transporter receptor subunit TctC